MRVEVQYGGGRRYGASEYSDLTKVWCERRPGSRCAADGLLRVHIDMDAPPAMGSDPDAYVTGAIIDIARESLSEVIALLESARDGEPGREVRLESAALPPSMRTRMSE